MPPRVGDELIADLLRSIPDDTTTTDRVLERLFVSRAGDDGGSSGSSGSSGYHASAAPRDTSVRDKKHNAPGPNQSIHFAHWRH
jgi:hypothetical protein